MEKSITIKVFLASPSDVCLERGYVAETVQRINAQDGRNHQPRYYLDLYRWENDLTSGWGTPQNNINTQLKPGEADIFIGILWSKFGTPTEHFGSGTEEEFEKAQNQWEATQTSPYLIFFKCIRDIPQSAANDFVKVKKFFKRMQRKITWITYHDDTGFKDKIYNQLIYYCNALVKKHNIINNHKYDFLKTKNVGITKIYTQEQNSDRNNDKIDFLNNDEGDIYLLAHSGNSYLNPGDSYPRPDEKQGLFFQHILKRIQATSSKIQVILLNPYSLEARKIYFAENFSNLRNGISEIELDLLEKGKNYKRFIKCLEGIELLKERLRENNISEDRLEVRICNTATDGTILIGKYRLFYEPYLSARFLDRLRKGLNIFEVQVDNLLGKDCSNIIYHYNSICEACNDHKICERNLYKTISEQFLLLWYTSIPLSEYRTQIHKYKEDFNKCHPDLFEYQIVQLHDSWFAFDPLIGCTGRCTYCFLSPHGWENTTPKQIIPIEHLRSDPNIEIIYSKLHNYSFYKQYHNVSGVYSQKIAKVPISIGNKTDMMRNIDILKQFLSHHAKTQNRQSIVLITKQPIPIDLIEIMSNASCYFYIFNSISFLGREYEPNVLDYDERIKSAKIIKDYINKHRINNVFMIHYWRPVTDIAISNDVDIKKCIYKVKDIYDCSVIAGLKITPDMHKFIKNDRNHKLHTYLERKGMFNYRNIDQEGYELFYPKPDTIVNIAKESKYELYLHTSCAISYLQNKADYNGSMFRNDICPPYSYCPSSQLAICHDLKTNWRIEDNIQAILLTLRVKKENIIDNADCVEIINESVYQEDLTFLTHLIGKPVVSKAIRLSLVWPSGNQWYYWKKYGH
ncbi:hypothetical protein [Candidatus Magnetominusculus xianensis]|uniref:DUF4062 domain-containing protein n=1 Tax=Candidatus Magnetominusculus xianensis TaxID=1748249 RepID=A0ABR5SHJ4_9BACT|nr:hypothetical protein [Candidatus Magnetominusculus xianensis]KWT89407.1 hypothetical protein ASN18_1225 [Candidatus Magnetominusculus xianensis]MBF0405495.1 hypothetical protein [Nitrospirota bacterium]